MAENKKTCRPELIVWVASGIFKIFTIKELKVRQRFWFEIKHLLFIFGKKHNHGTCTRNFNPSQILSGVHALGARRRL